VKYECQIAAALHCDFAHSALGLQPSAPFYGLFNNEACKKNQGKNSGCLSINGYEEL